MRYHFHRQGTPDVETCEGTRAQLAQKIKSDCQYTIDPLPKSGSAPRVLIFMTPVRARYGLLVTEWLDLRFLPFDVARELAVECVAFFAGRHSKSCRTRFVDAIARAGSYAIAHPRFCRECHGNGFLIDTYDPSPHGVSLGSGSLDAFETCHDCVDANKCPRCSAPLDRLAERCTHCTWDFERQNDPECIDFYPDHWPECDCHDAGEMAVRNAQPLAERADVQVYLWEKPIEKIDFIAGDLYRVHFDDGERVELPGYSKVLALRV